MKTKEILTLREQQFRAKVAEKYENDIEEICFMAQAIRLEEMCFENGMSTKQEYQEKIENWAKRIKVIAERLDDLKIN